MTDKAKNVDSVGRPRFTILIPTRNRPETLGPSLATCLAQDFDDYEIVVCDNSDGPETADVVAAIASPRIRYLPRPAFPLAMSANWERGLAESRGEYVTVLGDDDGLMPFALRELDLIATQTGARAIHWKRGLYTWPTIGRPAEANLLLVPLARSITEVDGRHQIAQVISFEEGGDLLPMIYCSVIHQELIAKHREIAGRVFVNIYPDIYSGFAFAYLAGSYVSLSVPMSLAGLSHASNGVATLMNTTRNHVAKDFETLNAKFGYVPHARVPSQEMSLQPVHTTDSFLYAKDALFPDDDGLTFDRKEMTLRYLAAIIETDPKRRAVVRGVIRDSLLDDQDLLRWFDEHAPEFPPAAPLSIRPPRLGYNGEALMLDVSSLGVRDVADAVHLAATLLGADELPIAFDMPTMHSLWLQSIKVPQLEHQLAEAQHSGSLRYVPRRLARRLVQIVRPSRTAGSRSARLEP